MKNKNFYYTKKIKTHSKMYGYNKNIITVYEVKQNKLIYVGECIQNTGSTCGDTGEVWQVLQANNKAPKKISVFGEMYTYLNQNNILIKEIY